MEGKTTYFPNDVFKNTLLSQTLAAKAEHLDQLIDVSLNGSDLHSPPLIERLTLVWPLRLK
jgi:hypothetical protein